MTPSKPTEEEVKAQEARLQLRRELRLQLLAVHDKESKRSGDFFLFNERTLIPPRELVELEHRYHCCSHAIWLYEQEYPSPPEPWFPGLEETLPGPPPNA